MKQNINSMRFEITNMLPIILFVYDLFAFNCVFP